MVMTTNCTDAELAESFMNFMLDPDVASRNSVFVGYTSPIKEVADELAETEFEGISAYVPVFGGAKNEVFRYQELKLKQYIADLWTKVKAY